MKKILFLIFKIAIALVLILKIANWIFDFSDQTNFLLNTAMFSLIGIAYLYFGFALKVKLISFIMIACGAFLIIYNFIEKSTIITVIGIICLIVPMIIFRFDKKIRSQKSSVLSMETDH